MIDKCIISMVIIKVLDDSPELGFAPFYLAAEICS